MCTSGGEGFHDVHDPSHDGGKHINEDGVCEYHCSSPNVVNGVRYCGEGPEYEKGDSIDCQPAQGNSTRILYVL